MLGRIAGLMGKGVEYAKAHPGMAAAGAIGTGALGYGAWSMMRPTVDQDGIAQQAMIQTAVREQQAAGGQPGIPGIDLNANKLPEEVWMKERTRTANEYEKALQQAQVQAFYNKQLGGNLAGYQQ